MPRDKKKVESGLTNKGFRQKEGDHHFFIYWTLDGKTSSIRTKTSHTPKMKEISDGLLGQMAKQCKLNKQDYLDLVDCPMDQKIYEQKLEEMGLL